MYTTSVGSREVAVHRVDHRPATMQIDPGFTEPDAARAFDPFYRSEDSRARSSGGTGLGLAIVGSVIDAHGGTITLTSTPSEGAAFTIWLPVDPAIAEGRDQAAQIADLP
jgi:signal transduction histidine kinase